MRFSLFRMGYDSGVDMDIESGSHTDIVGKDYPDFKTSVHVYSDDDKKLFGTTLTQKQTIVVVSIFIFGFLLILVALGVVETRQLTDLVGIFKEKG